MANNLLTEDEKNVLSQALTDYMEGVDNNCDDPSLVRFIEAQVQGIERKLDC